MKTTDRLVLAALAALPLSIAKKDGELWVLQMLPAFPDVFDAVK
jgi:hypothetical protein